jgi:hypothetical protein
VKIEYRIFNGADDWAWINDRLGILWVEDTTGIIAVDTLTGNRVAACMADNFTRNSVQAHILVTTPLVFKHGLLETFTDLIFNIMGKKYIYGMVPSNNEKAVNLNKHIGFVERTRLPEAFADGVDYIVMEMTKDTCNYLPSKSEAA